MMDSWMRVGVRGDCNWKFSFAFLNGYSGNACRSVMRVLTSIPR